MAKMFNYMVITMGIWILLSIMGITLTGSYMQSKMGIGTADGLADIQSSLVWLAVIAGLIGLGSVAVFIGIFTKTISAIPITAGLASAIFIFIIMDIIQLLNLVAEPWLKNVLWLFVGVYTAGFIITTWDWVRGMD